MTSPKLTPQAAIRNPIVTAVVAALLSGGGILGFTTLDEVRAEAVTLQRVETLERELDDTQELLRDDLRELSDALNNNTLVGAQLVERITALTGLVERLHP